MTKKKTKDGNQIAVEFRSIATDAVKMLKAVPFVDVRQRLAVSDLFDRLADNDIALQDLIRKQQVNAIVDVAANESRSIVPPAAE
jgi:hypothetical protein